MLDIHRLERRSQPPHGDARVLVTGRIGFRQPTGSSSRSTREQAGRRGRETADHAA
jgi:hypothetical protein